MVGFRQFVRRVFGKERGAGHISLGVTEPTQPDGTDRRRSTWAPRLEIREHLPHPQNAPGPFYSENEGCIACGAPNAEAPDLMEWYEEPCTTGLYSHCIFCRQPETPDEVQQAIRAMNVSCVENLRYRGTNPAIVKQLHDMGKEHLCDALGAE
jgi:hypothetical protein